MKHVILGAGPAGICAAEQLRRIDRTARIVVVGGESEPPYSRMAIPYLLADNIDETGTYLRKDPAHFENLDIRILNDRAESVSRFDLRLKSGRVMPFDRLLIATGSRPMKPPIDGLERDCVFHCWTLEDARGIAGTVEAGSDVVLMGAGFIGCIILEALVQLGVNLTVIEMEDRMVPSMMDATAGNMIKRWCKARGVRILTGTRVVSVEDGEDGDRVDVVTSAGEAIAADAIVVATGVRANTDFLKGSEVAIDQGVVVDQQLQTSVYGIFAAGDVAQGPDFSTGGTSVHAIQTTASQHGRIAALNMAGKNTFYHGSLVMNTLDTLGLISTSYGNWQGVEGGDSAQAVDRDNYRYMSLQFEDDVMVGAIAIGITNHIGALRGLIESRHRLGAWKQKLVNDPHRVMEAYVALMQAK